MHSSSSAMTLYGDYTFHPLPDLGSATRHPTHAIASVESRADANGLDDIAQSALRAALAKVFLLYLDSRDFLFSDFRDGLYFPFRTRVTDETQSLCDFAAHISPNESPVSLSDARAAFALREDQTPFPVLFQCGQCLDIEQPPNTLLLTVKPNGHLIFSFDSYLMSPSVAETFLNQVVHVSRIVLDNPSLPFNAPLILPSALQSSYGEPYNPSDATLSTTWLKRNAQERPSHVAHEIYSSLSEPPTLLTFFQLHRRSNQLARWLCDNGVQQETKIAVCRHRDEHFYVAHAAVFKSGGCYVAIDPDLPPERTSYIVQNSDALFVFTTSALAPMFGSKAVVLDELQPCISSLDDSDFDRSELDSLAYLLYTSGTTGAPKGCLLMHRGLHWAIASIAALPKAITNPSTDKRLAMASIAFDVHISEILQSWYLSLRLVSAPRFELLADLQDNIEHLGITHLGMVPSMIEATLTKGRGELPLKYLVSGGEKVSDKVLEKWCTDTSISPSNPKPFLLANFYGPTEATIGCTSHLITAKSRPSNIGKPFPGVRIDVVYPGTLKPVPRGAFGELVIWGPLVGRGYLGLEKETEKAFVTSPDGEVGYKTGDLVRMMPDSTLEIHGRIDTQIKLRGVRIESEGVSSVLRVALDKEQQVEVCTIIGNHPSNQSDQLVSFVCPIPASSIPTFSVNHRRIHQPVIAPASFQDWNKSIGSMRHVAEKELPTYMRPSFIIPIEFLPLNLNGKTDSKVLKKVFEHVEIKTLVAMQEGAGGPQHGVQKKAKGRELNELEGKITIVVKGLMSRKDEVLLPDTDLFELGFDSLRFAKLARELSHSFSNMNGTTITASQLMTHATIEAIASLSESPCKASTPSSHSYVDDFGNDHAMLVDQILGSNAAEVVLPPFPVQEGILFRATQPQSREQYVQHFLYRILEPVDIAKLRGAWEHVMNAVEILRTCFIMEDELVQVVLKEGEAPLPFTEHVLVEADDQTHFINYFNNHEASRICRDINDDITKPIFRVNIYPTSSACYHVLSLNHAIYDGNAVPLLMDIFDDIYRDPSAATLVPLVPIKAFLSLFPPPDDPAIGNFWRDHFNGINVAQHKFLRPTSTTMEKRIHILDASLLDIQRRCEKLRITVQAFFVVVYALSIRDMGMFRDDQGEPIFGVVRNGRSLPHVEIDQAICPLVSVVPTFLSQTSASTSLSHLLRDTQKSINDTTLYEHTSLGQIQRYLGVHELIDTLFSCRYSSPKRNSGTLEHIWSSVASPEFVLALELVLHTKEDHVEARAGFTVTDISAQDVDALFLRLDKIIAMLLEDPEQAIQMHERSTSFRPAHALDGGDAHCDIQRENELVSLISQYMKLEDGMLHATTSFVSAGLSSLKAVGLARFLSEHGSLQNVSAIEIIQTDSVRSLSNAAGRENSDDTHNTGAEFLQELKKSLVDEIGDARLSGDDVVEVTGCTSLQAGMLSQTLNSEGKLYVHAFTFKLENSCDIPKLRGAWSTTIRSLDILRTSFHFASQLGRWAQVLHSDSDFKWREDTSHDVHSFVLELILSLDFSNEATLQRPPLYLYHVKDSTENYLVVLMHHALYDGVAASLLFEEVQAVYRGESRASRPQFFPLADELLSREASGVTFWTQRLAMCHIWDFPRQRLGHQVRARRAAQTISANPLEVQRLCRRYHLHPQCVGQAAWTKVLALSSSSMDVVFGHITSGRLLPGSDEVIGPVFNTIPCRFTLSPQQTNLDLLRNIQQWNTEGIKWQHTSLRDIQRHLRVPKLCDSLFLFQPASSNSGKNYDKLWTNISGVAAEEGKTQYAINIEMHERSTGYIIQASCSADVLSQEEFEDLLKQLDTYISELVSYPSMPALPELFVPERNSPDSLTIAESEQPEKEESVSKKTWSNEQMKLCTIVADFSHINIESISGFTTLNSLGIDSISSIQIASLAKKDGIFIRPSDVARCRSINELVLLIPNTPAPTAGPLVDEVQFSVPSDVSDQALRQLPLDVCSRIERFIPATPAVEWNIGGWDASGRKDFKHSFVYSLPLDCDIDHLKTSWKSLYERHEILRTNFLPLTNSPSRLILYTLRPHFESWTEKTVLDGHDDIPVVRQLARSLTHEPGPIHLPQTAIGLVRGRMQVYFILVLHHMQYDAWSLRLLMDDFRNIYFARQPTSYSNPDLLFTRTFSPSILESQKQYWRNELGPNFQPNFFLPVRSHKTLPREYLYIAWSFLSGIFMSIMGSIFGSFKSPWSPLPSKRQCKIYRLFPGRLDELEKKAASLDVSLPTLLIACWAKVQAQRSSASGATFALSTSGRSLDVPNIDTLAFPTYNILPIHVPHTDGQTVHIANHLQRTLRTRTPEIEQTYISDISKFIGRDRQPLYNVYVNVVKLPPTSSSNVQESNDILKRVKFDYVPSQWDTVEGKDRLVPEFSYDYVVEIVFNPETKTVSLSLESSLIDEVTMDSIAQEWEALVNHLT